MHDLTPEARARLDAIAARHGVSPDAALALLRAMAVGRGVMAQFDHPIRGWEGALQSAYIDHYEEEEGILFNSLAIPNGRARIDVAPAAVIVACTRCTEPPPPQRRRCG